MMTKCTFWGVMSAPLAILVANTISLLADMLFCAVWPGLFPFRPAVTLVVFSIGIVILVAATCGIIALAEWIGGVKSAF